MDVDAFRRQLVDELEQLVRRLHKGIQFSELRADVAIHPLISMWAMAAALR